MYDPTTDVFTGLTITILPVTFPSMLSFAVAPASTYALPTCTVTGDTPVSVIVGAVTSGV